MSAPTDRDSLIQHFTFSPTELEWINDRRGDSNRLGFAVQLCYMKAPGMALADNQASLEVVKFVGEQLGVRESCYAEYGSREQTRRQHAAELQSLLGVRPFELQRDRDGALRALFDLALQTDKGIQLAMTLIRHIRDQRVLLPAIEVIEKVCAEAVTNGERRIYETLTQGLTSKQRQQLDELSNHDPKRGVTRITWLRQDIGKPSAARILEHIERLKCLNELNISPIVARTVHQNRLLKLARIGNQMTVQHLRELEPNRRLATLVAVVLETRATVIDEIVEMSERIVRSILNHAKKRHEEAFLNARKSIHEKLKIFAAIGRTLQEAKKRGTNPIAAIGRIVPWDELETMIAEAEALTSRSESDFLPLTIDGYRKVHQYAGEFLRTLDLRTTPVAQPVFDAAMAVKRLHAGEKLKDTELPLAFVKPRWRSLVVGEDGVDRQYYELCAMVELTHALRSGDIWVHGSRQFKDFEEYLLPRDRFEILLASGKIPVGVEVDCDKYLAARLEKLRASAVRVDQLARDHLLDDVVVSEKGLKVTPYETAVSPEARQFVNSVYALLPRVKITDVLLEVAHWTKFTRHFRHLKSDEPEANTQTLLTGVLADALNLGLTKMAEACPGTKYDRLSWCYGWHVREQTYAAALGELVAAQAKHPLALNWGNGSTSASDGQRFRTGGHAFSTGLLNPKYGSDPGVLFYSWLSDQYAAYWIKVITSGLRDSTHVLDGLLHHDTELRIKEHYTDTAGFTDHVFAGFHMLGYKFCPRISDLPNKRLHFPSDSPGLEALDVLRGDDLNIKVIKAQWSELLRLMTSIRQGTVTASVILRKLGGYPRQNGLAAALTQMGRLERSLYMLEWYESPKMRRTVGAGLNKIEARHALSRAVMVNRAGEVRDRTLQAQKHRASGLNLVVAAIVLWNTVYLDRAITSLRQRKANLDWSLLPNLSPLGWQHINLTGDYVWPQAGITGDGFRALRTPKFE